MLGVTQSMQSPVCIVIVGRQERQCRCRQGQGSPLFGLAEGLQGPFLVRIGRSRLGLPQCGGAQADARSQ
jgi:hypothetical protein